MSRVKLFEKYAEEYADMFDIFNNTTAQIVEKTDYDDYKGTFTFLTKGSVTGDLQPYSSEFAQKDYGMVVDCQYVFYCRGTTLDEILEPESKTEIGMKPESGMYLIIDGKEYEVRYVIKQSMGAAMLLKEETEHD